MGQATAKQQIEKFKEAVPELQDLIPELKDVTLKDVVPLNEELGRGAYGSVFTVKHGDVIRAAKKVHPILIESVSDEEKQKIKEDFVRECLCCSSIRHSHIVQFVGVFYHSEQSSLPIMVMELMHTSLTKFIANNKSNIPFGKKISILHDASQGLSFLHNHKPQILHRDLSPNNIMLTSKLVAKIGDLGVAKVVRAGSKETISKLQLTRAVPGTPDFMPPEVMKVDVVYGAPIDVFSFGGIALHVFSEEWPTPGDQIMTDPVTEELVALSEAKRRQKYLDKMTSKAAVLREIVEQCLSNNPKKRPLIQKVSAFIETFKGTHLVEALQSGDYHIKWTTCSDLPTPMYDAYVAVSNGTIYCTGTTPNEDNLHEMYCYNIRTDQWKQLPRPGHRLGVIHMVDDKLTIFGGRDPTTRKNHNKVTTYNCKTNSWHSHFPNLLHNRFKPGIVTSHDYVIVMGGKSSPDPILDNMEVMNYHHLQWREVCVHLPVPMWAIRPTISGNNITIVGYSTAKGRNTGCYQIPTKELILSFDQSLPLGALPVQWKKLSPATHFYTATIPNSNSAVIIGGHIDLTQGGARTSDVSLYDTCKDLWKKVDSLTSARSLVGVALLDSHTIIVIGGTSAGIDIEGALASSLRTVEIGTIIPNQ